MARRTDFTESDDENLVEFIAYFKPTKPGRMGNNLYIVLEESVDERPWARRHPWQSWRERYRKNQDWFNFKIKKYQKKNDLAKKEAQAKPKKPEPDSKVAKGKAKGTTDKVKLESKVEGSVQVQPEESETEKHDRYTSVMPLAASSNSSSAARPALSATECEAPISSSPTYQHTSQLLDRKICKQSSEVIEHTAMMDIPSKPKVESIQSNVNVESSQTGVHEESASETEDEAELYRGLFSVSQFSDDGGDESLDAPERVLVPSSFNVNQDNIYPKIEDIPQPGTVDKERHMLGSSDGLVNIKASPTHPHAPEAAPKSIVSFARRSTTTHVTIAPPPTRPPQEIRSKPKRKLLPREDTFFGTPSPSPSPAPYRSSLKHARATSDSVTNESWPPKRMKKTVDARDKNTSLAKSQMVGNNGTQSVSTNATPLPKSMKDPNKKKHDGRVASSNFRNSMPIKPIHRLIATPTAVARQATPVDTDDPFITNRPLDKGKGRASSSPIILQNKFPRRIDLRQSLTNNNYAPRKSPNLSSRTSMSSTSTSCHSVTSFLLPEDQELVNRVGFPEVMAIIAKHYGFDVDVAMNAFFATKSIEKTKSVLQHAKDVANSATSVLLAELADQVKGDDVDFDGDEEPQDIWRGRSSSSRRDPSISSGHQKPKHKAKRPSLNIKPVPLDEEIGPSEYSPPHATRAGQFIRLVKQGRTKEAINREQRRVSGTFVAQTPVQNYDQDKSQRSLSLMPNSSPILNSGQAPMDIDSRNDDAFQSPIVTPHKETIQDHHRRQSSDDDDGGTSSIPSPIVDPHRIFFKRISEGQSGLNEDEDDPAVLKLAQEHRGLVMNVTEENANALRGFEQKNNQDLMRLWSLDWVRQSIADM